MTAIVGTSFAIGALTAIGLTSHLRTAADPAPLHDTSGPVATTGTSEGVSCVREKAFMGSGDGFVVRLGRPSHAKAARCGKAGTAAWQTAKPEPGRAGRQKPSRSIRLRASLRARRTASAFSRALRSEGFS